MKTPGVVARLQEELDSAIPQGTDIPTYEMVKGDP
jgi:benzoate 4-monooxygenase